MSVEAVRRRRLEPDARREQILSVAVRLFGERGYAAVSTGDVAAGAGVARGLVNHYFGTKKELYLEVVRDHDKSASAQVALVASATLHLEHLGDPRGAMQRFRAAIGRVSGPLAEEARYGLAEAYRALGDFLRHHGDSALADRARARRAEL